MVISTVAGLTLLFGCANTTDPTEIASTTTFEVCEEWAAFAGNTPQFVDNDWLRSFGSAKLVALVDEALINNRDLRIAAASVTEARVLARRAGADLVPTVDSSISFDRENEFDSATDRKRAGVPLCGEA